MAREIKVTATVSYTYDLDELEDFGIENGDDAVEDVKSLLDRGEVTAADFDFKVTEL
jgi:hypothetical protein